MILAHLKERYFSAETDALESLKQKQLRRSHNNLYIISWFKVLF